MILFQRWKSRRWGGGEMGKWGSGEKTIQNSRNRKRVGSVRSVRSSKQSTINY
jgi:hypothetical protein